MSSNWRDVQLGDIADEVTVGYVGPMASEYVQQGIPFLRSLNVREHLIDLKDVRYISPEFHQKLRKSMLHPGDVVTVRTGKPGVTAVIPGSIAVANCSDVVITRPGNNLDSRWLSYYINGVAEGFVASRLVGAVQQHFNVESAKEMRLLLPPIQEQRAIAAVLGALDEKIESNRRKSELQQSIAQELFRRWFVEYEPWGGSAPKAWGQGRLQDVLGLIKEPTKPGQCSERPYVPIDMLPMHSLGLDNYRPYVEAKSSLTMFKKNDILIGAMRVYFHRVVIAPFDGVTRTTTFVLRPHDGKYLHFAVLLCNEDRTIDFADTTSRGSTMPYAVWSGGLADLPTRIPPVDVVLQFSSLVAPLLDRTRDGYRENKKLSQLRDALLPGLLSGRIVVPELQESSA